MDLVPSSPSLRSYIVIDDDPDIRATLARVLGRGGHTVVCFPSVTCAVPYVSKAKVDVIFLDICMPGIDGVTLLAHLRRVGVGVPVVVISGTATNADLTRIDELDATFLRKPFSIEELRRTISTTALERNQHADASPDRAVSNARDAKPMPGETPEESFRSVLNRLRNDGFPELGKRVAHIRKCIRGSKEDVDVSALLSLDTRVAARIVAKANSPLFGGDALARSLDDALAQLGNAEVARLAIEALLQPSFKVRNADLRVEVEERWNRGVRTAHAARLMADATGMDADEVYLATLSHNVGEFLVIAALDAFRDPRETAKLDEHIRNLHEDLGAELLQNWGMPEAWSRLAASHHSLIVPLGLQAVVQLADSATSKDADRDTIHEGRLCAAVGLSLDDYRRIRDLVSVVH